MLEGLRANEEIAWKRLVELYSPLIDFWCRQVQLQDADTADIRQEVFLSVRRKIGDFHRQPAAGAFRGWLRMITRNKISDLGRRRRSHPEGTGGRDQLDQIAEHPMQEDAEDATAEARILYRRALALIQQDFEEHTWRAFWGVVIDGRGASAVALDLGVEINVVYLAKSRVLKRLREEFEGLLEH